jgi:hypothetical protein
MPYSDVPERLLSGEAVPASEILGYALPNPENATRMCLEIMCMALVMERSIVDDHLCYSITAFGQDMRRDFVVRIEGDCPECPECP